MRQHARTRIADRPDGTVVKYDDGTNVIWGIVCRPPHLGSTVVYTPGGYCGLMDGGRFWSVVTAAIDIYRSEATEAEQRFRQQFA